MALSHIDMDIADAIMEAPIGFSIRRRQFCIYPMSLGKTFLVGRILDKLGLQKINDDEMLSSFLMLAIAKTKRDKCLKLIAYCTLPGDECLYPEKVERRVKELKRLKDGEVATLISVIMTSDKSSQIRSHFAFDEDKKKLDKIMKVKMSDGSNVIIGGKSIWGNLIDFVCERYGWTVHYVLWGISYANLNFLIADHVRSVFLTKEERKKAHVSSDNIVIKSDNPDALREFVATQNWR